MKSSWWWAAFAALLAVLQVVQAAVMSIDYGTEWFKVGLIKPGIPLDVALNKDSKRKTQAIVTLRGDERLYGSDALALASRFPHQTYSNLKSIVGKPFDDKHSIEYRKRFVNRMIADPRRNAPVFQHDENRTLTVEELIAYQFQNAREQARNAAGEDVKDVVITVAPYMTQYERQAILDAAELAGLNVLTLIHDETAVALNYAVSREFSKTPENHIFYDMGAGSTVASIVSFSTAEVKEGKRTQNVPQLEVKAIGFDRTLGGHEFDVRLQSFLAEKFMENHGAAAGGDIRSSESAMSRLLKEANRVKQILSANTETMASIESLYNDIDFKTKVTRADLERLCKDLLERVPGPIEKALEASGMKADDIKSLVLVGGGVRVPAIQKSLSQIVGAQKIAKNVNADEAAVLGAAFRGASLSNQFRLTKQIQIKDVTVFPIEITYQPDNAEEPVVTCFNESTAIGTRKILTFKKAKDFEIDINYGNTLDEQDKALGLDKIAKVKVTGVSAALEKHKDEIKDPELSKVRVIVELSNSGIISVSEATLGLQLKEADKESFSDKVKSFFGSKEELENKQEKEEEMEKGKNSTEEASQAAVPEGEETKAKPKETTVKKIPLDVEFIPTGPLPLSPEEKAAAYERIRELDRLDEKRRLREESRNNLESFVYRVQEYLYDDDILAVSTEEQQEELRNRLSKTSDWLYDEGEDADTQEYLDRLRSLQLLERPITFRRYEYTRRSENINKLDASVKMARNFVETIRRTPEEERYHTEEELDALLVNASKLEAWRNEKVAAQEKLANHVDPVLTTSEVKQKCEELETAVIKLMQKKKPKPTKKVEKNETEAEPTPQKEQEEDTEHDEL